MVCATIGAVLTDCPECSRRVSDRALVCPECAFPLALARQEAEAKAAAERERTSRVLADRKVDCPQCEARGFILCTFTDDTGKTSEGFSWCTFCRHSGRVALVSSSAGYFAVRQGSIESFVAGEGPIDSDPEISGVYFLGEVAPLFHRYESEHQEVE
jgi:hypothetical protein